MDEKYDQTPCIKKRDIAKYIYSIWTRGGSDMSGLAFPFFSGQIDTLGMLVTEQYFQRDDNIKEVARIHSDDITYKDFHQNFMSKNKPVIISGLTDRWKAASKWITPDPFSIEESEAKVKMVPDMVYLKKKFGEDIVSVHMQPACGGFKGSSNRARRKDEMRLSHFSDWWSDYHLSLLETGEDKSLCSNYSGTVEDILYMKDWQFVAQHPTYEAYSTPVFFRDDWLNGKTGMGRAYRFIYLGPKGTVTPLQVDVLNSYSWSTNICGAKRWKLVPAECTHLLYDVFGRKLAVHMDADIEDYSDDLGPCLYPGLAEARRSTLSFIQEEGDTLFVPSGWHHTVENLAPTLSINHNWINATNIMWSWDKVLNEIMSENFQGKKCRMEELCTPSQNESQSQRDKKASEKDCQGNDIYLLWLIISRKARILLDEKSDLQTNDYDEQQDKSRCDLKKVLCILESMQSLDFFIRKVDNLDLSDIYDLVAEITAYLSKLKIKSKGN